MEDVWIVGVLQDIRAYAAKQGYVNLERHLDETSDNFLEKLKRDLLRNVRRLELDHVGGGEVVEFPNRDSSNSEA